ICAIWGTGRVWRHGVTQDGNCSFLRSSGGCEYRAKAAPDKGFNGFAGKKTGAREATGRAFNGLTMRVSLLKCEKSCINDDSQVPKLMKNVYEVLRQKEMELTRLEKEVEALRLVAPLLSEEKEINSDMVKPMAQAVNGPQAPIRIPSAPVVAAQPVRAAGWDDTAKRWP